MEGFRSLNANIGIRARVLNLPLIECNLVLLLWFVWMNGCFVVLRDACIVALRHAMGDFFLGNGSLQGAWTPFLVNAYTVFWCKLKIWIGRVPMLWQKSPDLIIMSMWCMWCLCTIDGLRLGAWDWLNHVDIHCTGFCVFYSTC